MTYKLGWKEGPTTRVVTNLDGAPYTVTDDDCAIIVFTPAGLAGGILLPAVSSANIGKMYIIQNNDFAGNPIDINASGADIVVGSGGVGVGTWTLPNQNDSVWLMSAGTLVAGIPIWFVMGTNP